MDSAAFSKRKKIIYEYNLKFSQEHSQQENKKRYSREEHYRYLRFLIPEGLRVLDLGCGSGDLLASLKPSYGVGIDFNKIAINTAISKYPSLHFFIEDIEDSRVINDLEGPFDIILMTDIIGELDDIQAFLAMLHQHFTTDTRLIITYYNPLWGPMVKFAEVIGFKKPQVEQNWLSTADIRNIVEMADFDVIKQDWRQLVPLRILGLGHLFNRYIGTLPLIRKLCLRNYAVARSQKKFQNNEFSTSILIPCRNERGNIEDAIKRTPQFCKDMEFIFVEGHSKDGTLEEIYRVRDAYPGYDIKVLTQPGIGKADAVRAGFSIARSDILMILDADLTMPPEDLPKYYQALISGKGEFVNGSRLVYPMEKEAMRFLNHIANRVFSWTFTYLLNQRFTDTLCGTKSLFRRHYQMIVANRSYFGDFDPFGDFDLIFGATKLNLKVVEVPIRYSSRLYGTTQISRLSHGVLLVKMVIFAFRKLKAF
jgi:2-polyprenyl-3-methyl-5-hydroxy-6-metoxy-1,4-benzoquinol methylase